MERSFNSQKGAVLITFALLLTGLVGFTFLAMEVGRWYLIRAELSKAVDAAALAAAKNISNPNVNLVTLAQEFGFENFSYGYLGTPGKSPDEKIEKGAVSFVVERVKTNDGVYTNQFQVTGTVSVFPIFSALFGIDTVVAGGSGVAQKNVVEIMMVLDRSGSMKWVTAGGTNTAIVDLKNAATSFLSFFQETQDQDKMGLISFATGVTVDHPLSINFVTDMTAKISAMTAINATNAEDAIAQAGGPQSFTDQTGLSGNQRVQQYLIFFTDGHPTAFKGSFRYNGTDYDAVVMDASANSSDPSANQCDTVYGYMGDTDSENFYTPTGQPTGTSLLPPTPTGDGNGVSGSPLTNCSNLNTRWYVFGDPKYGLTGYNPLQCSIPESVLTSYICNNAREMAIDHAQELKDKGIRIYTIGLGYVDPDVLHAIASEPVSEYYYYAPTSAQLEAIFKTIAKEIKLRLVQ